MPAIKTGEWLKTTLSNIGMSQKELAKRTGLSVPAISKIILGERYGSPETWKKITSVLGDDYSISVNSKPFVTELYQEILVYGDKKECFVYYEVVRGSLVFREYLLLEDIIGADPNDLPKMEKLRITLGEAYNLFKSQDSIY